jgi:hypothetical protein
VDRYERPFVYLTAVIESAPRDIMKSNQSLSPWLIAVLVLCANPLLYGQVVTSHSPPNPHDLSSQVKAFDDYSKDFRAMQQPAQGEALQLLFFLDQVATTAQDRLYAANAALKMYDGISCKPDRVRAKRILKDQLESYSWVFDSEVTRTSGGLTFVKVPAAAQTGLRMKDDLRSAKQKLDAIVASLD